MDRRTLLEGLLMHLWAEKPHGSALIRDVLLALLSVLSDEGFDFSTLQGADDLAMWIAHSYETGFTQEELSGVVKAFRETFPAIERTHGDG